MNSSLFNLLHLFFCSIQHVVLYPFMPTIRKQPFDILASFGSKLGMNMKFLNFLWYNLQLWLLCRNDPVWKISLNEAILSHIPSTMSWKSNVFWLYTRCVTRYSNNIINTKAQIYYSGLIWIATCYSTHHSK